MAELIGSYDWATSSLGPGSTWPSCLRIAVDLMLTATAQIVMFWGPDFVALYNDAYAPTIGDKHPRALGRPASENWSELWDDLEPLLKRVLEKGETVSAKDRPFYIERHGHPENVFFDISYSPVRDEAGLVRGVFCIVSETTERVIAQETSQRLAAIIESSDDAIMSIDLAGTITSWNAGAERLYGYTAAEIVGQPVTVLLPKDRSEEEQTILARIRNGERVDPYETRRVRKSGTDIDVSLTVSPVRDATGRIVGASKIARDIRARKEAERLQRVLMNELKHRVKNVLATVQAIAMKTFRGDEHALARAAFEARLLALSKAHDLLTAESWSGAELATLVAEVLSPHDGANLTISGPQLRLPSDVVLSFSLALHELATNAAKYGALSVPSGRVDIHWSITGEDRPQLTIAWRETGGPVVEPPRRKGFGTRLIELLSAQMNGEVRVDYAPTGLVCEITAPFQTDWSAIPSGPSVGR
ncbi:MAG TPA: PAS domain S-box protein [Mesorhizobium sp.]|jgi:PAS domain S-box-containing protein|uniref:sensor histidine kinase n=1 Tax=Mesorhizobium sp. TaxID=1871066 RepID=UPI002DDCAF35|nr:PAS domain S-box protein [Mesorhizobium sp.]HEV2503746.1 PAS domain S-box protein [Mesorhizobium sp.]